MSMLLKLNVTVPWSKLVARSGVVRPVLSRMTGALAPGAAVLAVSDVTATATGVAVQKAAAAAIGVCALVLGFGGSMGGYTGHWDRASRPRHPIPQSPSSAAA